MGMDKYTIRPGYLISLKTTLKGGVEYLRKDIENNDKISTWETTRKVDDPEEHERGVKVRGKARNTISKVCTNTAFGLLCAEDDEASFNEAVKEAEAMCREYNTTAKHTHVDVYVLKGKIEPSDEKAARAIAQEIAQLITDMNDGIDKLDAEKIREAATKAKQMSGILSADKSEAIGEAVKQARKAANMIVRRIENDGEKAEIVIKDIQRGALEKARLSFLDMSDDLDTTEASGEGDEGAIKPLPERPERLVEMDDNEIESAEARRDFDAVDVPEVTPDAKSEASAPNSRTSSVSIEA